MCQVIQSRIVQLAGGPREHEEALVAEPRYRHLALDAARLAQHVREHHPAPPAGHPHWEFPPPRRPRPPARFPREKDVEDAGMPLRQIPRRATGSLVAAAGTGIRPGR